MGLILFMSRVPASWLFDPFGISSIEGRLNLWGREP